MPKNELSPFSRDHPHSTNLLLPPRSPSQPQHQRRGQSQRLGLKFNFSLFLNLQIPWNKIANQLSASNPSMTMFPYYRKLRGKGRTAPLWGVHRFTRWLPTQGLPSMESDHDRPKHQSGEGHLCALPLPAQTLSWWPQKASWLNSGTKRFYHICFHLFCCCFFFKKKYCQGYFWLVIILFSCLYCTLIFLTYSILLETMP